MRIWNRTVYSLSCIDLCWIAWARVDSLKIESLSFSYVTRGVEITDCSFARPVDASFICEEVLR